MTDYQLVLGIYEGVLGEKRFYVQVQVAGAASDSPMLWGSSSLYTGGEQISYANGIRDALHMSGAGRVVATVAGPFMREGGV